MDPITDVFESMQVASVVHVRLEATASWGLVRAPLTAEENATHFAYNPGSASPREFAHFSILSRGNS